MCEINSELTKSWSNGDEGDCKEVPQAERIYKG